VILATPILLAAFAATDITGDGSVDGADIALVISAWGTDAGDVTGDNRTDALDLVRTLNNFGWSRGRNDLGDGSIYLMHNAIAGSSPFGGEFTRWTETDPTRSHTFTRGEFIDVASARVYVVIEHTVFEQQIIDERVDP